MDISTAYIKMCASPEIQEVALPLIGNGDNVAYCEDESNSYEVGKILKVDSVLEDDYEVVSAVEFGILYDTREIEALAYYFVRLLEQDTLQYLIMDALNMTLFRLVIEFHSFYNSYIFGEDKTIIFDTLEKCWLAFYMKSVHNMEWYHERWVLVKKV